MSTPEDELLQQRVIMDRFGAYLVSEGHTEARNALAELSRMLHRKYIAQQAQRLATEPSPKSSSKANMYALSQVKDWDKPVMPNDTVAAYSPAYLDHNHGIRTGIATTGIVFLAYAESIGAAIVHRETISPEAIARYLQTASENTQDMLRLTENFGSPSLPSLITDDPKDVTAPIFYATHDLVASLVDNAGPNRAPRMNSIYFVAAGLNYANSGIIRLAQAAFSNSINLELSRVNIDPKAARPNAFFGSDMGIAMFGKRAIYYPDQP